MDAEPRTHLLPDGRILAFCEFGDPDGNPIFHAHGVPSSRLEGALLHDSARKHGFRVISTDRPGIGRSTYLPNRRFLDYPKDISSLAEALGLERFGVMGSSGGGAHTAVCAYAIPERLTVNLTMCPFANFAEFPAPEAMLSGAEALTWRMARISPALVFAMCGVMGLAVRGLGERYEKWAATAASATEGPDGEVARANPEKMAQMGRVTAEAFAQGGRGVAVDSMIQYSDWGFSTRRRAGQDSALSRHRGSARALRIWPAHCRQRSPLRVSRPGRLGSLHHREGTRPDLRDGAPGSGRTAPGQQVIDRCNHHRRR